MKQDLDNQIDIEKIRTFMWENKLTIKDFCVNCNFSYGVYKKNHKWFL